jgi:hypothetical protein
VNVDMGIYAQDRWTVRRVTLWGGVRFDYFNIGIPAQSAPASRWVGARSFAAIDNIANLKDTSPRVGVSYDLFGTGKTALKAAVSRYVSGNTVFNTIAPLLRGPGAVPAELPRLGRLHVPLAGAGERGVSEHCGEHGHRRLVTGE